MVGTERIVVLLIGFMLDVILGDPLGRFHPVCGIGWLIRKFEKLLRQGGCRKNPKKELSAGIALVIIVCSLTGIMAGGLIYLAGLIHPRLSLAVQCLMCWQILAMHSLKKESMKVYHPLKRGEIEPARQAVAMIVGRDTNALDEAGITRAAVETIVENTSDGVIAPFFYLALGGPVLGFIYKAINTMDSMVGYRNDRYEYFGKAAARMDDLANFIPSRLSAVLMILAALILGYDARGALRIYRRDRYQHKSPNSAQTESVCAGALRIRLAGDAGYFGVIVHKPYIGDDIRPVECEDIRRANRLLYVTAILMTILTVGGYICLIISTGAISIGTGSNWISPST